MVRDLSATKAGSALCQTDCVRSLFRLLDEFETRYVVLSSFEGLLDQESIRLELAIHQGDRGKVAQAFRDLRALGYRPVQCLNHSVNANYFVFAWSEEGRHRSIGIDVISEHREGNLTLLSGEDIVRNRRRRADYWIPDPRSEFLYLFSKKVLKGRIRPSQADRLAVLVEELGEFTAQKIAARLLGPRYAPYAVWCCVIGDLTSHLGRFRRLVWLRIWLWEPWNPICTSIAESLRRLRHFCRPTGIFAAVAGKDDESQATLTSGLKDSLGFCFRSSDVLAFCETVSFVQVHRRRARSGLVLTNRSVDNIVTESTSRLMRVLRWISPKPDLVLVLQWPQDESRRQQNVQRALKKDNQPAEWIDTGQNPEKLAHDAAEAVLNHMESRFLRIHGRWLEAHVSGRRVTIDTLLAFLRTREWGDGSHSRVHGFAALPGRGNPQWLIPLDNPLVALKGLGVFTPWKSRARLYHSALSLAARTSPRLLTLRPVQVNSDRLLGLEHIVGRVTGEKQPVFAISVGARGRLQKITVQVMRPSGEVLGFAKIPMTVAAEDRARHEAEVLRKLASYPQLDDCVPNVLWAGEWQDTFLLFQGPVEGTQGPTQFGDRHFEFLHKLHRIDRRIEPGDALVRKAAEEWSQASPAMDPQLRNIGEEALTLAGALLQGVPVPCGLSHGDFTPWNTKIHRGRLTVFDWETAELAPVWWDVLHFYTQTACLLKSSSVSLRIPPEQATTRGVYLTYLLHTIVRLVKQDGKASKELPYRQRMLTRELRLAPFVSHPTRQAGTERRVSTYETR